MSSSHAPAPAPKKEAVELIHNIVTKLDKNAKAKFDKAFGAWKATWYTGENASSSNSITCTQCPEFEILLRYGPKYIPFVVYQLTKPDNLMACQLYNALERDTRYKGIQQQAAAIIKLNHERTLKFNALAAAWAGQQCELIGSNNSCAYTVGCDAYWELVGLGPSTIAYVMAEYAAEQDGWWHELLYELVHGQQSGGTFFKAHLYELWRDWFESKDYDQAPEGGRWPKGKWSGPLPSV